MSYELILGRGLYTLGRDIAKLYEKPQDAIEILLANRTQREVENANGIRSGKLLRSYAPRNIRAALVSGNVRTRYLESATGYADVYERGRRDRPKYYGRYVAKQAVDGAGREIDAVLGAAAVTVKAKIES